ncbi:MAG: shikimate kinase [Bryobacterales bacterium]|nr:shikimate kinase [Bryobacterales bacterium]
MGTKLARSPGIYLTGFMGSGKTTVGRLLADEMGWPFFDLDDDIEAAAGCTISELFASKGETEFRRIEHEALKARVHQVTSGVPLVLALGGGAFAQADNRALLEDAGISIWLDAGMDLIRQRIADETHRPLAQDPERFTALYEQRREAYAKADFHIVIDSNDNDAVVRRVMELPLWG